jgi:hypothetical protein
MISNGAGRAEMSDADVGILIVLHEMLCYDKEVMMMMEKSTHGSGEKPQLIALSSLAPLRLQCNADFACGNDADRGVHSPLPKHGPESLTNSFRYRSIIVDLEASHCKK